MKNFLDNSNNFDEFETTFSLLYEEVKKEVNMLITDLEQIDKFQPSTKSYRFASTLGLIYHQFESVEDEYCTQQEVKDYVKKFYLKFQNN